MSTDPGDSSRAVDGYFALTPHELANRLQACGAPREHAAALRRAVLRSGPLPPDYTGTPGRALPRGLIARLLDEQRTAPVAMELVATTPAADGSIKLALRAAGGELLEAVVMRLPHGAASVCVSSQVGCPVGCVFCASGAGGLVRNLATAEIVEQFAWAGRLARIDRAVVMGIGEPLLNQSAVLAALADVCRELPLHPRRAVISTSGRPEWIDALAAAGSPHPLAVSLHAADDGLRASLVPGARGVSVRDLVEAAGRYSRRIRGGRTQFQYVVLRGVNDAPAQIDDLAALLRGHRCFVNLIAWNAVSGMAWERPEAAALEALARRLRERGIVAVPRRTLGGEALAACGQLRAGAGALP